MISSAMGVHKAKKNCDRHIPMDDAMKRVHVIKYLALNPIQATDRAASPLTEEKHTETISCYIHLRSIYVRIHIQMHLFIIFKHSHTRMETNICMRLRQ